MKRGKHASHSVFDWYAGREDEKQILTETLQACGLRTQVSEVMQPAGPPPAKVVEGRRLILDQEQLRRMFRVTIYDVQPSTVAHVDAQLSGCRRLLGLLGCRACGCVPREQTRSAQLPSPARRWFDCADSAALRVAMGKARRVAQGYTKRVFSIRLGGKTYALKTSSLELPGASNKTFLTMAAGGRSHRGMKHMTASQWRARAIDADLALTTCFDGCGAPRVHGYCPSTRATGGDEAGEAWLLQEHAECTIDRLAGCSMPRPSPKQLARAFLSTVRIFLCVRRYSDLHLVDVSSKQFLVTSEWEARLHATARSHRGYGIP